MQYICMECFFVYIYIIKQLQNSKHTNMKPEIYIGDKSKTAAKLFKAMVSDWIHETEITREGNELKIAKSWNTASYIIVASSECELWEAADCMEVIKPTEIVEGDKTMKIGWSSMAPDDLIQAVKENSDKFCEMLTYWEYEVIEIK